MEKEQLVLSWDEVHQPWHIVFEDSEQKED